MVEFTLFDRPHRFHTHIVEGPYPIDGAWTFMPEGDGTTVDSLAEGTLRGVLRLLEPIATRLMRRQFVSYHENLRRNVEALDQPQKPAPELRPIRVSRRLGQTHARC